MPTAIKIFLTSLAIFDDIGAIIIIAVFYTAKISLTALVVVACCILILIFLNKRNAAKFVVGLIPSKREIEKLDVSLPYQIEIAKISQQLGIEYLDLAPNFKNIWYRTYYRQGMHWNARGHKIAAEALYDDFVTRNVIPFEDLLNKPSREVHRWREQQLEIRGHASPLLPLYSKGNSLTRSSQ